MKGLSVLAALALLVGAQLLAVQLRKAHALPAQHSGHEHPAPNTFTRHTPRPPLPPEAVFQL